MIYAWITKKKLWILQAESNPNLKTLKRIPKYDYHLLCYPTKKVSRKNRKK